MTKLTVQIDECLIEACRVNEREFPESIIERALKEKVDSSCAKRQKQTSVNIIGLSGKTLQGFIRRITGKLHV